MKKRNQSSKIGQEEMDSLTEMVDERFASFLKEGRYKDVLILMGNLSSYSLRNQLFILSQKEEATTVHGLRGWNKLGRFVKKGEKGIKILQPIRKKKEGEEEKSCLGFRVGYVFDLSQTDGEELRAFRFDEEALVEKKEAIIYGLKGVAQKHGYRLAYASEKELGKDCYGLCDHKAKLIKVKERLGDVQEISTLAHECGHALAHASPRSDFEGLLNSEKREIKEVEAESIACIVCAYLGLETENFNFSYIASWAKGDIAKFRKNLDLVSNCAKELINSIKEGLHEENE